MNYYDCPSCGSRVRVGGSCSGCPPPPTGRDRQKRRRRVATPRKPREQDESLDGLGTSDDDFDYDDFVAREFGRKPHRQIGIKWYWWVTAVLVLAWFASLVLGLL